MAEPGKHTAADMRAAQSVCGAISESAKEEKFRHLAALFADPHFVGLTADLIARETGQERKELLEALQRLRKSVIGIIWDPLGGTGDESDWFQCCLCGARRRDTRNLTHVADCPISISGAAISKATSGGTNE